MDRESHEDSVDQAILLLERLLYDRPITRNNTDYIFRALIFHFARYLAAVVAGQGPPPALNVPPEAPGSLTARVLTGPLRVVLSWVDNSVDDVGFSIERCTGRNCLGFGEIALVGAGIATHIDLGVSPASDYRYRVRAFNATTYSPYSNTVSIKT